MLNNPWVVGIGGGIVSGLLVYLITNIVVNKVSRKEYYNKVKEANREIIVLLIMSVSEERIPSLAVIKSLLKSLTRSYNIKEGDLNGIKETLEDLIKEIFETKFISNDKKNELSESLIELIDEHEKIGYEKEVPSQRLNLNLSYVYALTISVAILSLIMAILVIIYPLTAGVESFGNNEQFLMPFALGAAIAITFSLASTLRKLRTVNKRRDYSIEDRIISIKTRLNKK